MDHEVAEAVDQLRRDNLLSDPQAAFLGRVARGELVSVRFELQFLLWAGVLLAASGAGLLVKEHYRDIGPLAISLLLGAAALFCLAYVWRRSPPFTWERVPSPTLAYDYLLLLGVLLLGSELAYLEVEFSLLGPNWPWHLLVVSLLYLAAAYRFDSGGVLSLALTSFAAWRGVAVTWHGLEPFAGYQPGTLRWNALGCGLLFLAGAYLSREARYKAHFELVWGNLGRLLVYGALVSGVYQHGGGEFAWAPFLFGAAAWDVRSSYLLRRSDYFAYGLVAGYLGLLRFALDAIDDPTGKGLFIATSSLAVILFLIKTHRRMREGR